MRFFGPWVRFAVFPVAAFFSTAVLGQAALAATCAAPKETAKASLELRAGDVTYRHDLDTEGMRDVVNGLQGTVSGPWHIPLGLTVAEPNLRYETSFYYWKAQSGGHCVALAEASFSVGYDAMTVYVSSDYPVGSCEYDVILAHEEQHVSLNREALKAYEGKFKQAIARVLSGKKSIFAHQKSAARAAYVKAFERQLKPVMREMTATRNRKNGAIDTQESYARLMSQCSNWRRGDSAALAQEAPAEAAAPAAPATENGGQLAAAAPAEAPDQSLAAEPGPTAYIGQGRQMSKSNAKQLESALVTLPGHFPTRARLLGFYYHQGLATVGQAATLEARRRHILWLIENRPDSALAAWPEARLVPSGGDLADPDGYDRAKALWLRQAETHAANPAVRQNAAAFLGAHDAALADSLR